MQCDILIIGAGPAGCLQQANYQGILSIIVDKVEILIPEIVLLLKRVMQEMLTLQYNWRDRWRGGLLMVNST